MFGMVMAAAWPPGAEASPIRRHALGAAEASGSRGTGRLSAFLAGGPELWARVALPRGAGPLRFAAARVLAGPDPTASPLIQYLMWRHDLNPARFDRWHPRLGPALERLVPPLTVPPTIPPTIPPTLRPRTIHVPSKTPKPGPRPGILIPPPKHHPEPPTVPEPGTLTLSLALIGSGVWWRWTVGRPGVAPPAD